MYSLRFIKYTIVFIALLIYTSFYTVTTNDKNNDINNVLNHEIKNIQNSYSIVNNSITTTSDRIYDMVINKPDVLHLFYKAKHTTNKDDLAVIREKVYKKLRPDFENLKKSGLVIMLFSFENNKTFLRVHKPDKFGDDLSSMRYSFSYVNSNKKQIRGFEKGKISHAIRNIFPLFYNGEYIGSVDIAFSTKYLQDILEKVQSDDYHLILNKKLFKDNIWKPEDKVKYIKSIEHEDFLYAVDASEDRSVFSEIDIKINKALKEEISKNIIHGNSFALYHHSMSNTHVVSFLPIRNIKENKTVAYQVSYVENGYIGSFIHKHIIINVLVVLVLIILGFAFYYNIKRGFYLKEEVIEKTKEIEIQKSELKALVNSFDKNVIFSKTDLKGNIVHVSEAFCKISGYKENELIGKPHNIIRHVDMSKEAFKDMWKTLKTGNTWSGEVKNLKKDGSSYWVFSTIELDYDSDGNHIGYYAVRQDITAQKIVESLKEELEEINSNLEQEVQDRVNDIIVLDKEIQDTQREVVFTMGAIGETRSKETGNHVKRVAEYSKLLALHYGLPEDEAEMLKQASPMHDIGKVGIPDAILNKPGRFDEDERIIMNTHAQLGYDMLKHSTRPLLKMAAIVAYEHHEKWDGTGYPNKLKGEDIHIYGRITAVADVFDALGSDRVYKKGWELERILDFFKEEKGRHFDPKLIDIFFDNLDEFLEVRDKFVDECCVLSPK